MGHSEENKRCEIESEEFILSKQDQKEGDVDDIVNTDTDTDISETNGEIKENITIYTEHFIS